MCYSSISVSYTLRVTVDWCCLPPKKGSSPHSYWCGHQYNIS